MKNLKKYLLVVAAAASTAFSAASAQNFDFDADNFYAGVGYSFGSGDASFGSILGRVGYDYNDKFGFEADLSIGVMGEDEQYNFGYGTTTETSFKPGLGFGLYGVAQYEFDDTPYSVFGRVGLARQSYRWESGTYEAEYDYSGIAYGGGGTYSFNERDKIRAEVHFFDGVEQLAVTYQRKF